MGFKELTLVSYAFDKAEVCQSGVSHIWMRQTYN